MLKERNFNVEIRDGILGWDITKFHPKKKNDSSFSILFIVFWLDVGKASLSNIWFD